jgi:hypothetical protein
MNRYVRVFFVLYRIDGVWQGDGQWFTDRRHAKSEIKEHREGYGYGARIEQLDVPVSVLPHLGAKRR